MGRMPPKPRASFANDSRATPPELYAALHEEFRFTLDPCPLDSTSTAGASLWGKDGRLRSWRGERVFCNPPYSDVRPWLEKAREPVLVVYLLPVKSDMGWWHDWVMRASEVRFIIGRLRFGGMSGGAPFASTLVVFRAADPEPITRYVSFQRPDRPPYKPSRKAPLPQVALDLAHDLSERDGS
jgi:site-specific DNA-methyltransferase (adenine-specific)